MSMTTSPQESASKYIGVASSMSNLIRKCLDGKNPEIPKGTLNAALKLLNMADQSFANDGFPKKPLEEKVHSMRLVTSQEIVLNAYGNSNPHAQLSFIEIEEKVRDLLYLTESLPYLKIDNKTPVGVITKYQRLGKFYDALVTLGNEDSNRRGVLDQAGPLVKYVGLQDMGR